MCKMLLCCHFRSNLISDLCEDSTGELHTAKRAKLGAQTLLISTLIWYELKWTWFLFYVSLKGNIIQFPKFSNTNWNPILKSCTTLVQIPFSLSTISDPVIPLFGASSGEQTVCRMPAHRSGCEPVSGKIALDFSIRAITESLMPISHYP